MEDDEVYDLDYEGIKEPTIVYEKAQEDRNALKIAPKSKYKVRKIEIYRIGSFRT